MSYSVAVRTLCEFSARTGDLDLRFTPAPTALEGMEGHKAVQARRGEHYETEIALSGQHGDLLVSGRADGFDANLQRLEEIKTYRGHLDGVRPHHRALHWAQAKVYGHLLCQSRQLAQINIALVYFNIGTQQESVLLQSFAAADLQAFFAQQCEQFLAWAQSESEHRAARDQALAALQFPLGQFRAGQRDLSVAVYRTTQAGAGNCLMAQAPTGIGKTMGTLFPMLKACPTQALDKVFFLTAKGTGHALALHALEQVRTQLQANNASTDPAPALRVIQLQARDKSCEHPDKACHGDSCPLARGFYDRLPAARAQACEPAPDSDVRNSLQRVRSIALQHHICPYYLTQELAHWADVVVGDYHYFFDSAAMLYALSQRNQWRVGVLVDEAHNLLERARSMYSAELSQLTLAVARKQASGKVKKALDALQRHWNSFNQAQPAAYQAYAEPPASVLGALQRAVAAIADVQADAPLLPGDPVLDFYLQALAWLALADSFGPHSMVDNQLLPHRPGRRTPLYALSIRNIIPAPYLEPRFAAAQASVLFSGTLAPAQFYQDMLGLPGATRWIDVPGPFRAEQLRVEIASHVSTRFADREQSVQPIIDLIAAHYHQQPGNYLCFFSSFDYLQRVATQLQTQHPNIPVWQQTAAMDDAARSAFLQRFGEHSQGLGFAVLGGAFAEGVDLPGTRLIGAFIATLGLPQINPINEHMLARLAQRFGPRKAYDYTYLYPGLRKVVQAAGRVIRTEQDQGLLVLMDDRYQRAQVRALLPGWWEVG